jgi:hypothetical protein
MSNNKRKRGDSAGWFAEIPRELKQEFTRLYPRRRDIKLFTVAFVSWAIRVKPDIRAFALREGWNETATEIETLVESTDVCITNSTTPDDSSTTTDDELEDRLEV